MNNGNYEHTMVQTTRVHTTPKRVLHWDDEAVADEKNCDVTDYRMFLKFINDFESLSIAENSLSEGKWKLLYAIMRRFAETLGVNYCVYENPAGLLFDVTNQSIEFKEASLVRERETDSDQLQRLKEERLQLELKIESLQKKRIQINERILKLVQSLVGDEFDILAKPGMA